MRPKSPGWFRVTHPTFVEKFSSKLSRKHKLVVRSILILCCTVIILTHHNLSLFQFNDTENSGIPAFVVVPHSKLAPSRYTSLINAHGPRFTQKSKRERCELYLEEFYKGMELIPFGGLDLNQFVRHIVDNREKFVADHVKKYTEKELENVDGKEAKLKIIEERNIETIAEIEWGKAVKQSQLAEQRVIDAIGDFRMYSSCFLDTSIGDQSLSKLDYNSIQGKCKYVEARLFEWLSGSAPNFTRWDTTSRLGWKEGAITTSTTLKDDNPGTQTAELDGDCFLGQYRDKLKGTGITLTAADKHVSQVFQLIVSLRALGNKLPIEVVHSGDLSSESQQTLIHAARSNRLDITHIQHLNRFPKSKAFPRQDIWFVDVSGCVNPKYKSKFRGYSNKFLAYFFNSFRHTILIDTDTVLLVDPRKILKSSQYAEHGAYFFQDRDVRVLNSNSDSYFFHKMMPTLLDELILGIPETTNHTLGNRSMKDKHHYFMEAGLVAVDRVRHFSGVLAAVQLNLYEPVRKRVWGDKELFWLGMSVAGDEDYVFNDIAAAAIGELHNRTSTDEAYRVCSTHPGHISSDDKKTLLWFNSGFINCKKPHTAADDFKNNRYSNARFPTEQSLRDWYNDFQRIDAIMLPYPPEYKFPKGKQPHRWASRPECGKHIWCAHAYTEIEPGDDLVGGFFRVDDKTKRWHEFIGSVYHYADQIVEGNLPIDSK